MKALFVFKDGSKHYYPAEDCLDGSKLKPWIKLHVYSSRLLTHNDCWQIRAGFDIPSMTAAKEITFRLRRFDDDSFQYEEM